MNIIRILRSIYGIIVIAFVLWFSLYGLHTDIPISLCFGVITILYFAEQKAEKVIIKREIAKRRFWSQQ